MTLEFFGSGKHKISPDDLLEKKNVLLSLGVTPILSAKIYRSTNFLTG